MKSLGKDATGRLEPFLVEISGELNVIMIFANLVQMFLAMTMNSIASDREVLRALHPGNYAAAPPVLDWSVWPIALVGGLTMLVALGSQLKSDRAYRWLWVACHVLFAGLVVAVHLCDTEMYLQNMVDYSALAFTTLAYPARKDSMVPVVVPLAAWLWREIGAPLIEYVLWLAKLVFVQLPSWSKVTMVEALECARAVILIAKRETNKAIQSMVAFRKWVETKNQEITVRVS